MAHANQPATAGTDSSATAAVTAAQPALREPLGGPSGSERVQDLPGAYDELLSQYQRCAAALATAAHDLRTPLAVVSGYLELLISGKLGPVNDKQKLVLEDMQVSSNRLQRLVNDFLTFAAVQTGNFRLHLEQPQDLNACLHELAGFWLPRFQQKGVAFYYLANASLAPFLFDYDKIQRVVSNLLENALKFTPVAGTVWLNAEPQLWERRSSLQAGHDSDRRKKTVLLPNAVRVSVSDTGPGIAPEYHQEIFGDFFQLPVASTGDGQGTGLGLAIARRLIHAHGGKIWVESEPNCGCKFSFLLPLKRG